MHELPTQTIFITNSVVHETQSRILFLTFTSQYRVVSNNFYTVIEDLTLATHLDYLDCSSSRFMDVFIAVLYLHSNNGFLRAADFDPRRHTLAVHIQAQA